MRTQPPNGLYLGTVHASKGLEFRHVMLLDGGWKFSADNIQQERRLYYVGMTRAQQTLTLCRHTGSKSFVDGLSNSLMHQAVEIKADPRLETRYQYASLKDVDIGYAGSHLSTHPIHEAVAELRQGDELKLMHMQSRYLLSNFEGRVVGRMAASFKPLHKNMKCAVAGIIVRYRSDDNDARLFAGRIKCQRWEVVVPTMVVDPSNS